MLCCVLGLPLFIISAVQTKVFQDPLRPALTTVETINVAVVFM